MDSAGCIYIFMPLFIYVAITKKETTNLKRRRRDKGKEVIIPPANT